MPELATAPPPPATTDALRVDEHTLTLWDETELFYRHWHRGRPTDRAVVLFHRGHEHSGRFQDVVEALDLQDASVFAWDARGHGLSPGRRGHADEFTDFARDADCFVRAIAERHGIPIENMVVVAHSVGAVIAASWVHDYGPPIRGLVLVTPALRIKLYVPFAITLCRLLLALRGKQRATIKSHVRPSMLTHDAEQARRYAEDPLIARAIAVNVLLGLHDTSTRLMADAGTIQTPTLVIGAGSDWVVKLDPQRRLFDGLSSPRKRMRTFRGLHHDVLHEADRAEVLDEIRRFTNELFELEPEPRLEPERYGHTQAEYDRLAQPLSRLSPRGLWYGAQRLAMKTLGRLSRGISIGWKRGFDSGRSLDYVYRNRAQGITPLGRLIDRLYLDSVGWKGIRERKINLQKVLTETIERMHQAGRRIHLLDLAAGPGRYVLETLSFLPNIQVSALLRDQVEANLEHGRRLAVKADLHNVAFEQGDAFDADSIAAATPAPTIAIVSGLYELFPDNAPVRRSLEALARAVEPGGYLIYTNQPWHPQVEMIARVLPNRDGDPWVMRRRTQAEMDALVAAAGFRKTTMEMDRWGIFTVSVAMREAS